MSFQSNKFLLFITVIGAFSQTAIRPITDQTSISCSVVETLKACIADTIAETLNLTFLDYHSHCDNCVF